MDLTNKSDSPKIKRRNFFTYLGASVLGIFSMSKLPVNLFKSKLNNELRRAGKVTVKANPDAIKRNSGGVKNG
jgi:hypothetical protein